MSKQREAFEAYWQEKWAPVLAKMPGVMGLAFKEMAEHAWQVSRAAALEEAAEIADLWGNGTPEGFAIADLIRALKEKS